MLTEKQLVDLMRRITREPIHLYPEGYWIAFLALHGHPSDWASKDSITRTMSPAEAMVRCELLVKSFERRDKGLKT